MDKIKSWVKHTPNSQTTLVKRIPKTNQLSKAVGEGKIIK